MIPNNLIHFTDKKIRKLVSVPGQPFESMKPKGLWISVEDNGDGWKTWCEQEQFNLGGLVMQYKIMLNNDSNILLLKSASMLDTFHYEFKCQNK